MDHTHRTLYRLLACFFCTFSGRETLREWVWSSDTTKPLLTLRTHALPFSVRHVPCAWTFRRPLFSLLSRWLTVLAIAAAAAAARLFCCSIDPPDDRPFRTCG